MRRKGVTLLFRQRVRRKSQKRSQKKVVFCDLSLQKFIAKPIRLATLTPHTPAIMTLLDGNRLFLPDGHACFSSGAIERIETIASGAKRARHMTRPFCDAETTNSARLLVTLFHAFREMTFSIAAFLAQSGNRNE
jgi:hypothetical protein